MIGFCGEFICVVGVTSIALIGIVDGVTQRDLSLYTAPDEVSLIIDGELSLFNSCSSKLSDTSPLAKAFEKQNVHK